MSSHYTVNDHVGPFILLVAADNFIFAIFLISRKHSEELEDIHDLFGSDHILDAGLHICESSFGPVICRVPWAPHVYRHID